jgi:hypothetical protein
MFQAADSPVPVFVLSDTAQILQAFTSFFNILGPKGVIVHLMSSDYAPLKRQIGKRA